MTLAELIQIKQDRLNGIMICRSTIDKLIDYAHDLYWKNQHLASETIGMDQLKAELEKLRIQANKGEDHAKS